MSERTDGDRVVVTGYSAGSHFPRTQAKMHYGFEANGLSPEGPFGIQGSVYGRDLRFRGPGTVCGPVLGRGDITLDNAPTGKSQRFLGGLHASGHVASVRRAVALPQSLSGSLGSCAAVIRGDVIGQSVTIENALVFGNVRGRRVDLSHCIVVGQVLADEECVLSATTFLSYASPRVRFRGPCCALYAMGASEFEPVFERYTDSTNKTWESDLRFYPAFCGNGPMSNRPWEPETRDYRASKLNPADWVRVDATRSVQRRVENKVVEQQVEAERYILSIAGRALNFVPLKDSLDRLTFMVRSALEFDHYTATTQATTRSHWRARCTADEHAALHLVTDPLEPSTPLKSTAVARPSTALRPASTTAASTRVTNAPPAQPAQPAQPARPLRSAPTTAQETVLRAPSVLSSPPQRAGQSTARTSETPRVFSQVHLADRTVKKGYVSALDTGLGAVILSAEPEGGAVTQVAMTEVVCVMQPAQSQTPAGNPTQVKVVLHNGGTLAGWVYGSTQNSPAITLHLRDKDPPWVAWIPRSALRSVSPLTS